MSGAKFSGGRLHPQHLCPHSCTWAHAHVCTHSLTNTQSSRAIYFPQDLRREHNYSAPKLSHGTVLELYCRNVVTTHTQPRKWWARLRIPSKAISTLVAKPTMISSCTHGSIYVFSQAWVDMKVICQEFRSSDNLYLHTYQCHRTFYWKRDILWMISEQHSGRQGSNRNSTPGNSNHPILITSYMPDTVIGTTSYLSYSSE